MRFPFAKVSDTRSGLRGPQGAKDESQSESDNLPAPEVIAAEIVEDLEAALEQFREIANDLAAGAAGA